MLKHSNEQFSIKKKNNYFDKLSDLISINLKKCFLEYNKHFDYYYLFFFYFLLYLILRR